MLTHFWALSSTGHIPLSAWVKFLVVCVRVCWYCHQSDGRDGVDLPAVLLPEGQYLDTVCLIGTPIILVGLSDDELVQVG